MCVFCMKASRKNRYGEDRQNKSFAGRFFDIFCKRGKKPQKIDGFLKIV